jgi:hypothetical protein
MRLKLLSPIIHRGQVVTDPVRIILKVRRRWHFRRTALYLFVQVFPKRPEVRGMMNGSAPKLLSAFHQAAGSKGGIPERAVLLLPDQL